jgi:hypothetical protein
MQSRHQCLRQRSASTVPPAEYAYHCFISYTTRQEEVAELKPHVDKMIDKLKEAGVVVCPVYYDGWYMERRKYEQSELAERLIAALADSAFTLCFVSPGYVSSPWCRLEWEATMRIHAHRALPAPEYSILPVLWKPLSEVYFRRAKRALKQQLYSRLRWRGHDIVPPKARAVDYTGSVDFRGGGGWEIGSWHLLLAIQEYLDRWYPEVDWHLISGDYL